MHTIHHYRPARVAPSWWPALLAAVGRRDAERLAREPEGFSRPAIPGEHWPAPHADSFVTYVNGEGLRRLTVRQ